MILPVSLELQTEGRVMYRGFRIHLMVPLAFFKIHHISTASCPDRKSYAGCKKM